MSQYEEKTFWERMERFRIIRFLRRFFVFLRRFFSKSNILHGFAGVIKDFRAFAAFFAALTVILSLFWLPWMTLDLYSEEACLASRECDYNLLTEGYTEKEWEEIYNREFSIFDHQTPQNRGYISYDVTKYYGAPGQMRVRIKFLLVDDSPAFAQSFLKKFNLNGENVKYSLGERTAYHYRIDTQKRLTVISTVAVGLLGVVLLFLLFRSRAEFFRFRYGIFMAFGADFFKLVSLSGWEMFAAAVLSFLPSMGISVLLFWAMTGHWCFPGGIGRILLALCWILAIILFSVFPALFGYSRKTPLSLINKADNSENVVSPRVSFHIFGKSFPWHYEFYSILRFRKYYAVLLSSAVLFTTVFSAGMYLADVRSTEMAAEHPQFVIRSQESGVEGDVLDEIADIPGVDRIFWSDTVAATSISSHILLTKEQSRGMSGMSVSYHNGRADNNFDYSVLSDQLFRQISEHSLWKVNGNLERVVTDSSCIAVSCYVRNNQLVKLAPGDTVKLAALVEMDSMVNFDNPDKRIVLEQLLSCAEFREYTVTVAATVDDGRTGNTYGIYLSEELFSAITKRNPKNTEVSVWTGKDCTAGQVEQVRDKLCAALAETPGASVIPEGTVYSSHLVRVCRMDLQLIYGSLVVLLLSPLLWFYSQSVFVRKRLKETEMLSAFGATERKLRQLFAISGCMLSVLSCLATGLLTTGLTYLCYKFLNEVMPSLGFGESIRYTYSFDLLSFLLCVAVSSAAAILSTLLTYLSAENEQRAAAQLEIFGKERNMQK